MEQGRFRREPRHRARASDPGCRQGAAQTIACPPSWPCSSYPICWRGSDDAERGSGGRHSSVLKQPEDIAIGVGDGGYQAAATDVVRGLLHGGTRGGYLGQLRLDVWYVPVGHR